MTADPPRDDADDVDEAEDALSWDTSSRDASYVEGPKPVRGTKPRSADSFAEPVEAREPAAAAEPVEAADAPTSSILLVTYGIVAGVFLLYAIGWFTTVRRSSYIDPSVLGSVMSVLGEILAVAAAPVWFGVVFLLTRQSKPIVRLLWLLLGLVLLVPIPFVLGV